MVKVTGNVRNNCILIQEHLIAQLYNINYQQGQLLPGKSCTLFSQKCVICPRKSGRTLIFRTNCYQTLAFPELIISKFIKIGEIRSGKIGPIR